MKGYTLNHSCTASCCINLRSFIYLLGICISVTPCIYSAIRTATGSIAAIPYHGTTVSDRNSIGSILVTVSIGCWPFCRHRNCAPCTCHGCDRVGGTVERGYTLRTTCHRIDNVCSSTHILRICIACHNRNRRISKGKIIWADITVRNNTELGIRTVVCIRGRCRKTCIAVIVIVRLGIYLQRWPR